MDQFLKQVIEKAKNLNQTIVLPETDDKRVIKAAAYISKRQICRLILIGSKEKITKQYWNLNLKNVQFIDPHSYTEIDKLAQDFYELRKHKGLTLEQAKIEIQNPIVFGLMLVKNKLADGLVAGATVPTPHLLRPTLQIFKSNTIVSAFFILSLNNKPYIFADSGMNINPDIDTLAQTAIESAKSYEKITGLEPKVALLSYTTHTKDEKEELPIKIKKVLEEVKKINPKLIVDGDIQADAAINKYICLDKAPDSPLKGDANILIFPDLASGNIAYKLVQQFTGCNAFGPLIQGLGCAVNDLSRGCTVIDIVGTVCITGIQSSSV